MRVERLTRSAWRYHVDSLNNRTDVRKGTLPMAVDTLKIEERSVEVAEKQVERDLVVIWYHERDVDLMKALDPHLQLAMLRLGFGWHYFGYPQTKLLAPTPLSEADKKYAYRVQEYEEKKAEYEAAQKEQQSKYDRTVRFLQQRCTLFVPCISNACMLQMWKDTERDSRLSEVFAEVAFQIMPIVLRPTNTGEANPSEPLGAHDGYQLELACQKIAATMESMLRANPHYKPVQKQAPLATLFLPEPAPQVVAPTAPKKRRWSLFH